MSPQGSKSAYTSKQKRQAGHIEKSAMRRGRSRKTAERIAWATVNKRTGGGKKKRSATTRKASKRPSRKSTSGRKSSPRSGRSSKK